MTLREQNIPTPAVSFLFSRKKAKKTTARRGAFLPWEKEKGLIGLGVKLTERDKEFLKFLSEYRIIRVEDAAEFYDTRSYHEKRFAVLRKHHYIKRRRNCVYLDRKGREFLREEYGINAPRLPSTKATKERALKIARLYVQFLKSDWEFLPSWRVKEEYCLDRGGLYHAMIRSDIEYLVYNIGKEPSKNKLLQVKSEIKKLYSIGFRRVIIFAETPKAMASYGIEALGLDEQLLLPYTELGINIARELYNGRIIKKAIEKAVGKALEPAWVNADFSLPDGRQGVVLVTNDIEKRSRLQDYFRMARYRHTKTQEIVIVCLESQKEVFAQEFPRCEIISIIEEELFENQ